MKSYLPKIAGVAFLALMIRTSAFSQDDSPEDSNQRSRHHSDEIIIRHKGDKDVKVTIEMKDGEVLVNGKPLSEFDDSSLSISKLRVRFGDNVFNLDGQGFGTPGMPGTIRIAPDDGGVWKFNNRLMRMPRALLGVSTNKSDEGTGAKVIDVSKGSAAEKIGLKPGDIITKIDGDQISDAASLSDKISDHQPGDKVTVTYMRDGKEQTSTATLGKTKLVTTEPLNVYKFDMPDMKAIPQAWPKDFDQYIGGQPRFGIRAQDAEDGKGVKVLDVDDESTAAKAGIKEGDVITRFDGKDVNSVTALTEAAHAAKDKTSVKVTVMRDGKSQELDVRVPRRLRTADL